MSDARLRDLERALVDDPSAWRPLVAELRRLGRVAEARAASIAAWTWAKDRFDAICPDANAGVRGATREERRANLGTLDVILAHMDEALELGRVLLHELHHEDGPGRCYCEASALPHEQHLGRRGRRGRRRRAS